MRAMAERGAITVERWRRKGKGEADYGGAEGYSVGIQDVERSHGTHVYHKDRAGNWSGRAFLYGGLYGSGT